MGVSPAHIRPLQQGEHSLLADFLYEAIFVPPGDTPPPRSIISAPELQVYIEGFGRRHDYAFAAEMAGVVVGLAWARIMRDYGHVDAATPSLALAVMQPHRGQGIGAALLGSLLTALAEAGYAQASLSVQRANPARRLYTRMGFIPYREAGEELIMLKELR